MDFGSHEDEYFTVVTQVRDVSVHCSVIRVEATHPSVAAVCVYGARKAFSAQRALTCLGNSFLFWAGPDLREVGVDRPVTLQQYCMYFSFLSKHTVSSFGLAVCVCCGLRPRRLLGREPCPR